LARLLFLKHLKPEENKDLELVFFLLELAVDLDRFDHNRM
jgi:hypothetical protein